MSKAKHDEPVYDPDPAPEPAPEPKTPVVAVQHVPVALASIAVDPHGTLFAVGVDGTLWALRTSVPEGGWSSVAPPMVEEPEEPPPPPPAPGTHSRYKG